MHIVRCPVQYLYYTGYRHLQISRGRTLSILTLSKIQILSASDPARAVSIAGHYWVIRTEVVGHIRHKSKTVHINRAKYGFLMSNKFSAILHSKDQQSALIFPHSPCLGGFLSQNCYIWRRPVYGFIFACLIKFERPKVLEMEKYLIPVFSKEAVQFVLLAEKHEGYTYNSYYKQSEKTPLF